mgnify:CR=1 FL=1
MPSRKVKGEYRDICYPCTKDFKQQFDQKVLEAYEQAQVQEAQKSPDPEVKRKTAPPWQCKEVMFMKRVMTLCVLVLTLTMALCPAALAADLGSAATAAQVCYPTSISRSEDGTELKKIYDLGPEDDPAGIPRSDFEQDGFHYTLTDLLKQELPENESRQHTETVSLPSKNKDMESVLALLPAEKEFVTDDGLTGILSLDLSTVRVEVAGYGSSTKEVSATRSYPNLARSGYPVHPQDY